MVQFAKLRLTGFKSFVDPTELEIEPGITHVEWGPHGEVLMPPLPGGRSAPAKKTPGGRCP